MIVSSRPLRNRLPVRRVRLFAIVAALCLLAGCASAAQRRQTRAVENEIQVGRGLAARLARRYGLVRHEEVTKYINRVGRGIARHSSRPELIFYFGILDSDEINAFSCPGGYVLFTRGALLAMNDEAELAFVLAHEIAHVSLEHSGDFDREGGFVDFIAGLLGGGGGVLNAAIRQASDRLEKTLLENGRERQLEFDADLAGLTLAAQADYDPEAAVRYIRRMQDSTAGAQRSRTHPPGDARIGRIRKYIKEQGLAGDRREPGRFLQYKNMLAAAP